MFSEGLFTDANAVILTHCWNTTAYSLISLSFSTTDLLKYPQISLQTLLISKFFVVAQLARSSQLRDSPTKRLGIAGVIDS